MSETRDEPMNVTLDESVVREEMPDLVDRVELLNDLGEQLLGNDQERVEFLKKQIEKLLKSPTLPQTYWMEDGIGFVQLLWVAGDDLEVVNDARVSRHVEHEDFTEGDGGLIDFLQRSNPPHWTPFAGSVAKFRIKMPLFVAREWFRSTVGFNRNEVSRRYVKEDPEIYIPKLLRSAPKPGQNKQGVQDAPEHPEGRGYVRVMQAEATRDVMLYNKMIARGVAPEQARIVLPQGMYTEFRETGSLAAYQRLCGQRIHPAAQLETMRYAQGVESLLRPFFPHSWSQWRQNV